MLVILLPAKSACYRYHKHSKMKVSAQNTNCMKKYPPRLTPLRVLKQGAQNDLGEDRIHRARYPENPTFEGFAGSRTISAARERKDSGHEWRGSHPGVPDSVFWAGWAIRRPMARKGRRTVALLLIGHRKPS